MSEVEESRPARLVGSGASFVLGLFANQLADELNWPAAFTLVLFAGIFGVAYMLEQSISTTAKSSAVSRRKGFLSVAENVFSRPIPGMASSILIGVLAAFISLLPVWQSKPLSSQFLNDALGFHPWNYELLAFLFCLAVQIIIFQSNNNVLTRLGCSVMLGLGVAVFLVQRRPEQNVPEATYLSWLIAFAFTTIVLQMGQRILSTDALKKLIRAGFERTS